MGLADRLETENFNATVTIHGCNVHTLSADHDPEAEIGTHGGGHAHGLHVDTGDPTLEVLSDTGGLVPGAHTEGKGRIQEAPIAGDPGLIPEVEGLVPTPGALADIRDPGPGHLHNQKVVPVEGQGHPHSQRVEQVGDLGLSPVLQAPVHIPQVLMSAVKKEECLVQSQDQGLVLILQVQSMRL